jgi:hypothetical protein
MARNRLIFQSEAVYAGTSPSTGTQVEFQNGIPTGVYGNLSTQTTAQSAANQLTRVQSCNYNLSVPRTDVYQFGELSAIDRVIIQPPAVSLDISYILAGFANENYLGLTVTPTGQAGQVTCISGILTKTNDDRNFFVVDSLEGQDVNNNPSINVAGTNVYAFGNMYISSYTSQGSVGNLPTVDARFEGLNLVIQTGIQYNTTPAISLVDGTRLTGWIYNLPNAVSQPNPGSGDLTISALRHGDITLTVWQSGTNNEYVDLGATPSPVSGAVQGYRIAFDLKRQDLQRLGTRFLYSKEVQYPVTVNCSINGLVRDLNTGDLSTFICNDNPYDVEISIKRPGCDAALAAARPVVAKYRMLGVKLDAQSYSLGINNNKTFTMDFSRPIGSATQNVGLFMSGVIGS